jgi:probable rRNA maturation factor
VSEDPSRATVALADRQRLPVEHQPLIDLATRTLDAEGASDVELSVSLVTGQEMADLHGRYTGERGPTDVLSFPLEDETPTGRRRLLGDVVICPEVAAEQNTDLQAELRLLLVHGILHLLGYDHEEEDGRREMWRRQATYSGVRVP